MMAEILDLSEGLDVKHISDHYLSIINKLESNTKLKVKLTEDVLEDEIKETEELTLLEMAEDLCDIFASLKEQKQKLIDMRMKLLNETLDISKKDMHDFIDETKNKLLKFKEVYKNCEICLEDILKKAGKELNTSNVERCGQGELCVLFSISEDDLNSYISSLDSSRKSFHEFEINTEMELISKPLPNYPYNTVISAINEGAVACEELTTIVFKLLNLD